MTDHQFDALLDMVDMILDGCKSVKEAQEKLRSIRRRPGQLSGADPGESEQTKISSEAHHPFGTGADR